jgi:hypothetical protein
MSRLLHFASFFASLMLIGPGHAEVIDITDFVDQTPGFNETRPLGVTISGDNAVYLVGTMNFDPEELDGSFVEANMGDTNSERGYVAGFGNGFGGNTIVIAENGTRATAPETFVEGEPTLLVMKFDQTTGDTVLWVNPDLAASEALNASSATANVGIVDGSSFDSVVFRAGDFTGDASVVDFTDFAVYYNGDTPFGSVPEAVLKLTDFTYDPLTGDSEVSIEGEAGTAYVLVEADDLDFATPDQNPVSLTGATVGGLNGDRVTTDGDGNATVQFNLGTAKSATFIRAEDAPPWFSESFDAASALPAGWVSSGPDNGTDWEAGVPSGVPSGPSAATSEPNCAGTNIDGYYTENTDVTLTSPSIAIPADAAATLSFQRLIDTDAAGDAGAVRILDADNADAPIAGLELAGLQGEGTQGDGWTEATLPLPAIDVGGKNIKIRFEFVSDAGTAQDSDVFGGFYIDDVLVTLD